MNKLIKALKKEQSTLKETDAQFALGLGVSRSTWSLVRAEQVRLNLPILKGTLARFPELLPQVAEYISDS